jgi:hypothetical protein
LNNVETRDPKVVVVRNLEKNSDVWHLQRNVRASGTNTVHKVVWTDVDPDDEVDERQFINTMGAGRGKGFIRSLELGDRITVIARAMVRHLCLFFYHGNS